MAKYHYQFFSGLDAEGLETTIEEYQNAGHVWRVHSLFTHQIKTSDRFGPRTDITYDVLLERIDE